MAELARDELADIVELTRRAKELEQRITGLAKPESTDPVLVAGLVGAS